MADYITDDEISDQFFAGEDVPSANTIATRTNLSYKARIQKRLKSMFRLATLPTLDTYGDWFEASMELYQAMLNGEELRLSGDLWKRMKRRYKSAPMHMHNPQKTTSPPTY